MNKRYHDCKFTISEEKKIVKEYLLGKSTTKVGLEKSVSHVTILKILKAYDIPRRSISETLKDSSRARKHSLDFKFFDKVDSAEKAYVLGLMISDGYVYEPLYKVGIASTDYEIVAMVKELTKATNPIHQKKSRSDKHKPQYEISLNSKKLYHAIGKHGCVPRKSLTVKYPDTISNKFSSHFIRGLWDGDGGVRIKKDRYLYMDLTGSKKILQGVSEILHRSLGVTTKIFKHGSVNRLLYCCGQGITVRDYLYKDAKYFLKRKRDLAFSV